MLPPSAPSTPKIVDPTKPSKKAMQARKDALKSSLKDPQKHNADVNVFPRRPVEQSTGTEQLLPPKVDAVFTAPLLSTVDHCSSGPQIGPSPFIPPQTKKMETAKFTFASSKFISADFCLSC